MLQNRSETLQTPQTRIMLWTLPRSVSTAFEHSIRALSGVKGFHEPYSAAYYLGEERRSPRYQSATPIPNICFRDVVATMESDDVDCTAYFAKDMAYAIDHDFDLIPQGYTHSFLIRDPRFAIPSLYKIIKSGKADHWHNFLAEEFDYSSVSTLRDHLLNQNLACPIIADVPTPRRSPALNRPRHAPPKNSAA